MIAAPAAISRPEPNTQPLWLTLTVQFQLERIISRQGLTIAQPSHCGRHSMQDCSWSTCNGPGMLTDPGIRNNWCHCISFASAVDRKHQKILPWICCAVALWIDLACTPRCTRVCSRNLTYLVCTLLFQQQGTIKVILSSFFHITQMCGWFVSIVLSSCLLILVTYKSGCVALYLTLSFARVSLVFVIGKSFKKIFIYSHPFMSFSMFSFI